MPPPEKPIELADPDALAAQAADLGRSEEERGRAFAGLHDLPFMRHVEGSLYDSVIEGVKSAQGIYSRDSAPLPEGD